MQKKRFFSALVLFGLMGQVAWVVENMYFNVFIYNMFSASASDISLMVAASSIVATVTTIFIGALSDRIGKRAAEQYIIRRGADGLYRIDAQGVAA